MSNFFGLEKSEYKTEILAGLTTFFTMSYIIILIPQLLSQAGMPAAAVFTASLLLIGIVNIFMGLFSNLPFALAPYMGDIILIVYTLVPMGYSWREISAIYLIMGFALILMTVFKFRLNFMDSLPESFKLAFTGGLGICLLFSGLKNCGIIDYKDNLLSLSLLNLNDYHIWLGVIGLGFILLLDRLKVKMSIIIGLVVLTVLGVLIKDTDFPSQILSLPPSLSPVLFKCDFLDIFSQKMITLFFMLFLLVNTELHGSIVSVMMKFRADDFFKLQKSINRTLYVDSFSTTAAASVGIPATGVYVDSVTGIMSGGKTGLTSVVVGVMFLLSLLISPLFSIVPSYAYASLLLYIGSLLLRTVKEMKYHDVTEYLPFLLTLAVILFTLNLGFSMACAFILYPLTKLVFRRANEVPKEFWLFTVLSLVFFIIK
ncbi:NCS2 family permease [bacterium]|nr:NCS2 family permease [bacterium]